MIKEESMYEPIRNKLNENFSRFGRCQLEVTSRKFSSRTKMNLDTLTSYFMRVEKLLPDILGALHLEIPVPKYHNMNYLSTQQIVVEVKAKPIRLRDIYQTKTYAEIFNATYAFLIFKDEIPVEISRFLAKTQNIRCFLDGYLETQRMILIQYDIDKGHFVPSDNQIVAEVIDRVEKERILEARKNP